MPRLSRQAGERAFTLIELLTVIAIIAILSAIAFGVMGGVRQRAAISQAKTELAMLSQALEAYKKHYGDYPWIDGGGVDARTRAAQLYNALNGRRGPKGADLSANPGKRFLVDLGKFRVADDAGEPTEDYDAAGNFIADPWGNEYAYFYKTLGAATWRAPSYVLYSYGPDSIDEVNESVEAQPGTDGRVTYEHENNVDNIYANR